MGVILSQNFTISKIMGEKIAKVHRLLEGELLNHKATIHQKVLEGKTFDDKKMKAYTKKYADLRIKSGRNASPVDLTVTGSMLASMDVKIQAINNKLITGIIYFRNVTSIAPKLFGGRAASAPEKAASVMKKRKFFGISQKQKKEMIQRIKNKL